MNKITKIVLAALPILLMVGLIPIFKDDYVLTALYVLIILVAIRWHQTPHDALIFVFGFVAMIASEYLFISTGVETFNRNTLFGLMPIWLPFLWGYGFVAIKRSIEILNVGGR
jgi:hypothetical protein